MHFYNTDLEKPNPLCRIAPVFLKILFTQLNCVYFFLQIYIFPCWHKEMFLIAAILGLLFCCLFCCNIIFCQWYTSHTVGDACSLYFAFYFILCTFCVHLFWSTFICVLCISVPCGLIAPTLAPPHTWNKAWTQSQVPIVSTNYRSSCSLNIYSNHASGWK